MNEGIIAGPVVRQAQVEDIPALSELAIQTYSDAFGHSFSTDDLIAHLAKNLSPERFAQILERDIVLLAEVQGLLIGYVQFGARDNSDGDQELRRLYIHSEFQSKGYGGALMEAALCYPQMQQAARIYLDVWEHNPGAQRFYKRYGFTVIGTRPFDVESGAETSLDLIMMRPQAFDSE